MSDDGGQVEQDPRFHGLTITVTGNGILRSFTRFCLTPSSKLLHNIYYYRELRIADETVWPVGRAFRNGGKMRDGIELWTGQRAVLGSWHNWPSGFFFLPFTVR